MKSGTNNKMVISETPRLHIGDIPGKGIQEGLFKAFYGTDAALYYLGRGALWQSVQSMHLSASDNVLVPSYHCGVEIEAVAMTGVQLRYYDVKEDMSVDPAVLCSMLDSNSKAVLIIHYFGFPQPVDTIKALCSAKNVVLIEDCSQALFSSYQGKPLGTFGDVAIFSQRKTLPLPDGGALLVHNSKLESVLPTKKPSSYVTMKKTMGMLFRTIFNCNPRNELPYPLEHIATFANRLIARNAGSRYSTGIEIDSDRCCLAMSDLAKHIMDRTKIGRVIQRRRDNYLFLCSSLAENRNIIIREQLPDGVCPLFFPVKIKGTSRHKIQEQLLQSGIGTFIFGADLHPTLPADQFHNAEVLSRELLCLPVHQDLDATEMTFIAKAILQTVWEEDNADNH